MNSNSIPQIVPVCVWLCAGLLSSLIALSDAATEQLLFLQNRPFVEFTLNAKNNKKRIVLTASSHSPLTVKFICFISNFQFDVYPSFVEAEALSQRQKKIYKPCVSASVIGLIDTVARSLNSFIVFIRLLFFSSIICRIYIYNSPLSIFFGSFFIHWLSFVDHNIIIHLFPIRFIWIHAPKTSAKNKFWIGF